MLPLSWIYHQDLKSDLCCARFLNQYQQISIITVRSPCKIKLWNIFSTNPVSDNGTSQFIRTQRIISKRTYNVTLNNSPLPDLSSELHIRLGQQQKRATPSLKETRVGSVQLNFLTSKLSQLFFLIFVRYLQGFQSLPAHSITITVTMDELHYSKEIRVTSMRFIVAKFYIHVDKRGR